MTPCSQRPQRSRDGEDTVCAPTKLTAVACEIPQEATSEPSVTRGRDEVSLRPLWCRDCSQTKHGQTRPVARHDPGYLIRRVAAQWARRLHASPLYARLFPRMTCCKQQTLGFHMGSREGLLRIVSDQRCDRIRCRAPSQARTEHLRRGAAVHCEQAHEQTRLERWAIRAKHAPASLTRSVQDKP